MLISMHQLPLGIFSTLQMSKYNKLIHKQLTYYTTVILTILKVTVIV